MRGASLKRHPVCSTGLIRSYGRPWCVELVTLARKVTAVGIQRVQNVVVFWLVSPIGVGIAEGRGNAHLHVCNGKRKHAESVGKFEKNHCTGVVD